MSEWTRTPPTEPGYYWVVLYGDSAPTLHEISYSIPQFINDPASGGMLFGFIDENGEQSWSPLAAWPGVWSPRIEPPVFRPVPAPDGSQG